MVTLPIAKSVSQRPTSSTSSLELIVSTNGGSQAKSKGKAPSGSFWDDAGDVVLKAHEVISIDDLSSLGVRLSHELMSSYVHKVMQVRTVNEGLLLLLLYSFSLMPPFLHRCWVNPCTFQGSTWITKRST